MKIKALITIYHDGKEIKPNEVIDLKDDEAKRLIAQSFAIALDEPKETKKDKNAV